MMPTYELITSVTIGNTYIATLSNIPQTFTDLHLRVTARSSTTVDFFGEMVVKFNNYTSRYTGVWSFSSMQVNEKFTANSTASATRIISSDVSFPESVFTPFEMYIANYASSSADNKMYQFSDGMVLNSPVSSARMSSCVGWCNDANPITSISVEVSAYSFNADSNIQLYGIKSS